LLYASAGTTLAGLADVAVGSYLASGGVTTAPSWATLNQAAVAGLTTASTPTFAGVVISDGGTVGQAAGPLLTFDDTLNYLEISGCNVGIATTIPSTLLQIGIPALDIVSYDFTKPSAIIIGKTNACEADGSLLAREPVLLLHRKGYNGAVYAPFVEFNIKRYENVGNSARTQLDITLSHSNSDVGNFVDVMSLRSVGRVGINDTAPAEALDVTGNINVTGVYKVADVQIAQKDITGLTTASTPTFAGIVIADGGTVGQAAGPLLTFDDTNNYLEITGCNVGIGIAEPEATVHIGNAGT